MGVFSLLDNGVKGNYEATSKENVHKRNLYDGDDCGGCDGFGGCDDGLPECKRQCKTKLEVDDSPEPGQYGG